MEYGSLLVITLFLFGHSFFISGISGATNNLPDGRIVGGQPTTIENHPWQVSIQVFGNHDCGGVIISPDIILTAAHCVNELIIVACYVVPGVTDLAQAEEKVQVKEAVVHELFNSETYDYDIAILKLSKNLTFSEKIQNIGLPDEAFTVPVGTKLQTSGWGITDPEGTQTSDILLKIEVEIIDWDLCRSKLSSVDEVTSRMICASASESGKDTCQADSGGALELNSTLIGIVSWGKGCAVPGYPGVYTHVSYFRSWIMENAGV